MDIRQLHDTRRLRIWLRAGKTVELREGELVIGRIVPTCTQTVRSKWPDFAARTRKIFGDKVLPGADLAIKERGGF
jgi:hypothetical protein